MLSACSTRTIASSRLTGVLICCKTRGKIPKTSKVQLRIHTVVTPKLCKIAMVRVADPPPVGLRVHWLCQLSLLISYSVTSTLNATLWGHFKLKSAVGLVSSRVSGWFKKSSRLEMTDGNVRRASSRLSNRTSNTCQPGRDRIVHQVCHSSSVTVFRLTSASNHFWERRSCDAQLWSHSFLYLFSRCIKRCVARPPSA